MKTLPKTSLILKAMSKAGLPQPLPAELVMVQAFTGEGSAEYKLIDGKQPEIRSEIIRFLCIEQSARELASPYGLIIRNARISGTLDLAYVRLTFPLEIADSSFEQKLEVFQCETPLLSLTGSALKGLDGQQLTVKGHLLMNKTTCEGAEVVLVSCHISGNLDCSGASFSNPEQKDSAGQPVGGTGVSLSADGAIIDGYVLLRGAAGKRFSSEGELRLLGAQIGGDLDCTLASLHHQSSGDSYAMDAERVNVKGSVYLREGFESIGAVRLEGSQVGGEVILTGGRFMKSPEAQLTGSLYLSGTSVRGSVDCSSSDFRNQFYADGDVTLTDARIGGILNLDWANLQDATLYLGGATASGISDFNSAWPKQDHLYLMHFAYGAIVGGTKDAKDRLVWLGLQPSSSFNTDSYTYLAKVLSDAGDDDGARLVLRRIAELQVRYRHPFWFLNPSNWFQASIGFGYRPIWAVWEVVALGLLGWIIYRRSYLAGAIVPTDKDAYDAVLAGRPLPQHYTRFSALMFSVENSLPIVKLGQVDKWQPNPSATASTQPTASEDQPPTQSPKLSSRTELLDPLRRTVAFAFSRKDGTAEGSSTLERATLSRLGTSPQFLRRFIWLQILLGWVCATLFVAGVGGFVRK